MDAARLEDIYLPYRPKRRTRASVARQRGLEGLALAFVGDTLSTSDTSASTVAGYINVNDQVPDAESAIAGAKDIIAEWVSENAECRDVVRGVYNRTAVLVSKATKSGANAAMAAGTTATVSATDKTVSLDKYKDYTEFSQPMARIPSHRLLAILRGQREGVLKISLTVDDQTTILAVGRAFCKAHEGQNSNKVSNSGSRELRSGAEDYVAQAVADGYKRLIVPSIEAEVLSVAKERADIEAINVFANNLRQLLLEAPLGERLTMGIDPGFRTGCKVVCLSAQGDLLAHDTIYPHTMTSATASTTTSASAAASNAATVTSGSAKVNAQKTILSLIDKYNIEAIAIGNGTAGRETQRFVMQTLTSGGYEGKVAVFLISEDGASIYSASQVARDELGEYDITVRGAASIGRRLMDPLAELVKIEPKSIGVGQYQHDVDQKLLRDGLGRVVESCVNRVGVNLNTASVHLLSYISGLNAKVAGNIVAYRSENGAYKTRAELLKVPRLGAKGYEQAAGFLRIAGGTNPLDSTAVHPESYSIVEDMARDLGVSVSTFIMPTKDGKELRNKININHYVSKGVGNLTITAIMNELNKEGRGARQEFGDFEFTPGIETINDLKEGMVVKGIVTNITNFGAFVNIGVKQDGLVHISQMANRYVANPSDVVSLKQEVMVKITEIDYSRGRIGLSMKALLEQE